MPGPQSSPVDVLIVGAGAAGLCLAAELAEAGKQVQVLESGPRWALSDLISSQIWARRLKWRGMPVQADGEHRFGHNMATGSGLGGAALHHYAMWPRLREEDFTLQSRYGRGRDWPLSYADLRPYYDRIQREFGIAGDNDEPGRPPADPYPMPPMPRFRQAEILARGFARQGLSTCAAPVAINTRAYQGRPACLYDGWCDAGCPTGALANPLVVHLPRAERAGVAIRTDCTVTRITDDRHGRVKSVLYRDENGAWQRQNTRLLILAASVVENARMLLNSRTARYPRGVGNTNGYVGHYFGGHSMAAVFGLFPEDMVNYQGVSAAQQLSFDGYTKLRESGPFGSYIWGIGQALKPNDLVGIAATRADLFGQELDRFMRRDGHRLGVMMAECETLSELDNRVSLAKQKDPYGVPLAKITHTLNPESLALWEHAREQGKAIMRDAGAETVWTGDLFFSHPLGGTVMGAQAGDSVVDSYGRSHEVPNLFIAGGGLFPSVGAVGPTFTIYALALRSAEYIKQHWQAIVGEGQS